MTKAKATGTAADFVSRVRRLIADRTQKIASSLGIGGERAQLLSGKMLRTRLAARLADCDSLQANRLTLERACAATEMVHTASLCHDDVIDNSLIRRARPAFWRSTGSSKAVLVGDLLLCEAVDLLLDTEDGRYVGAFVAKVREVCTAEAEHEIKLRGEQVDEQIEQVVSAVGEKFSAKLRE